MAAHSPAIRNGLHRSSRAQRLKLYAFFPSRSKQGHNITVSRLSANERAFNDYSGIENWTGKKQQEDIRPLHLQHLADTVIQSKLHLFHLYIWVVEGLSQGHNSGSLTVLAFDLMTAQAVVQHLNLWATTVLSLWTYFKWSRIQRQQ